MYLNSQLTREIATNPLMEAFNRNRSKFRGGSWAFSGHEQDGQTVGTSISLVTT